jgi:PAS domain S-box-containing protein/putative nucleotidyltransferase with HDIG domain
VSSIESRLAEAVNIGEIPVLPEVARIAISRTLSLEKSAEEIAKIIREDPSLTLKIMKLANSPLYTRDKPVSNIKDAIILLGYKTIKSVILSVTIKDIFSNKESKRFNYQGFWIHSLAVAHLSEEIARILRHSPEEDAYAAGLLHDIGKVILLLTDEEDYHQSLGFIERNRSSFKNAETKVFGLDHADIAEFLFKYWDIPGKLSVPVRDHHKEAASVLATSSPLSPILKIANEIAHIAGYPTQANEPPYELTEELVERLGLLNEDLDRIVHTLKANIDARIELLNLQKSDTKGYFETLTSANRELGKMFVDNQQIVKEVSSKTSVVADLNKLSLLFLKGKNIETVLREAIAILLRAFDFDAVSAEFYLNEEKSLLLKVFHPKLFADGGKVVRSSEVEESRRVVPRGSVTSFGASAVLPLHAGGGAEMGKLFVEGPEKKPDPAEMKSFVDHISLGLSNVRLHLTDSIKTEKLGIAVRQLKEENESRKKVLELNRLLLDNTPVGILSVDESGRVVTCNREAEQMLGEGIKGMQFLQLSTFVQNNLQSTVDEVLKRRESADLAVVRDGKHRTFHLKVAPVESTGQRLVLLSDITERIENDRLLIQKEKMATLGELAAGIAHNLRSPLAVVKGIPEMILEELDKRTLRVTKAAGDAGAGKGGREVSSRGAPAPGVDAEEEIRENMKLIAGSVEKAFSIIDSLMEFSRTDKGEFTTVDLHDVAEDARTLLAPRFKEKDIRWENRTRSCALYGNHAMLTQVFLNLIANSIDAVREGGTIEATCSRKADRTIVQVIDDGSGIEESELEKVFEPFYTHSGRADGTGIGLSVTRKMVVLHGGSIRALRREGGGTVIEMTFPRKGNGTNSDH